MSRVASAGSSVGVASGALRRVLAALTCFGFSIGVVSSVFSVYGDGVARRKGLFEGFVQALFEFFRGFFGWVGFHHGVPLADCTNCAPGSGASSHAPPSALNTTIG